MPEKITSRLKISPWQIALCFALCCVVAMIAAGSFAKFNDKVSANEKQKPNKTKKFQVSPNKGLTPEESKQLSQMYSEWQNP
ncbi:MAG TPA: SipW-dependent-type signal peptide-containing protein, partial [Acidobacteriota bacterium]|nr:SipW-dependent-type signal peptide-containing protein [Acidobacteriota bacterium]